MSIRPCLPVLAGIAVVVCMTVAAAAQDKYVSGPKGATAWKALSADAQTVVKMAVDAHPDLCKENMPTAVSQAVSLAARTKAIGRGQGGIVGNEAGHYLRQYFCSHK